MFRFVRCFNVRNSQSIGSIAVVEPAFISSSPFETGKHVISHGATPAGMRQRKLFDQGWLFCHRPLPDRASAVHRSANDASVANNAHPFGVLVFQCFFRVHIPIIAGYSFVLAFNDFAIIIRFSPRDTTKTDVQFTWLVHEDATEGRDYDPEFICWAWDVTTRQDKAITESNQEGVHSSRYGPGPYSEYEMALRTFQKWYFNSLLN